MVSARYPVCVSMASGLVSFSLLQLVLGVVSVVPVPLGGLSTVGSVGIVSCASTLICVSCVGNVGCLDTVGCIGKERDKGIFLSHWLASPYCLHFGRGGCRGVRVFDSITVNDWFPDRLWVMEVRDVDTKMTTANDVAEKAKIWTLEFVVGLFN